MDHNDITAVFIKSALMVPMDVCFFPRLWKNMIGYVPRKWLFLTSLNYGGIRSFSHFARSRLQVLPEKRNGLISVFPRCSSQGKLIFYQTYWLVIFI